MKMPFTKTARGGKSAVASLQANPDGSRIIPKGKKEKPVSNEEPGVIRVGKTKYAVDLDYRTQPENLRDTADSIGRVGQAQSWTLYTKVGNNRVAFGSPDIGHRKGMLPLAASIRNDLLGDNWVLAIPLEGGKFWCSESKNGNIVQDEVMANAQVAQASISGRMPSAELIMVVPQDWNIPGSTTAALGDLVGRKASGLRKFSFWANNGARIVIIGLVLLVVGGVHLYFKSLEEQRVREEREMVERRERRVLINDADYPWFQKGSPQVFLETCARLMGDSVRLVPGWTPEPVVCQYADSQVVATHRYRRADNGRVGWLREAYVGATGAVTLDPSANLASYVVTEELVGAAETFSRTAPWAPEQTERVVRERFQNLGLAPSLTANVSRAPQGAADSPTFNSFGFSMQTGFFPSEIVYLMSDVPATVPESLVWNMDNNTWALTMSVYHPAILPLGAI